MLKRRLSIILILSIFILQLSACNQRRESDDLVSKQNIATEVTTNEAAEKASGRAAEKDAEKASEKLSETTSNKNENGSALEISDTILVDHQPSWIEKENIPMNGGFGHTITMEDKIYAFLSDTEGHITVCEYLTDKDQWKVKSGKSTTVNKGVFSLACIGDKAYVMGGYADQALKTVEEYDISKDTWRVCKDMPAALDSSSAAVINDKIYVTGGADNSDTSLKEVWEYDPAMEKWTKKADMNYARREHGSAVWNGKLYTLGGHANGTPVNTLEVYDPIKDEWKILKNPQNLWCPNSVAIVNGTLYSAGDGRLLAYDIEKDSWSEHKGLDPNIWGITMSESKGKLYALGGYTGTFPNGKNLNFTLTYNPGTLELYHQIDELIKDYADNSRFNGSVLVAVDDKVILSDGYGYKDFSENLAAEADTVYWLASIGKQFTSMCIMQLYEKGQIDIDAPITDYLPEFTNWKDITVSQLMSHTSGLQRSVDFYAAASIPDPSILDAIKDDKLDFQPGSSFSYSNTGYYVLGLLLERVSGIPYHKYIDTFIFTPLHMKATFSRTNEELEDNCATSYTWTSNGYQSIEEPSQTLFSVGSIYSTVEDLYRWDRALNTEKLVKEETINKIFSSHTDGLHGLERGCNYGYGWVLTEFEGHRLEIHGGYSDGCHTIISRYPDENIAIILLSNCNNAKVEELEKAIAHTIFKFKSEE